MDLLPLIRLATAQPEATAPAAQGGMMQTLMQMGPIILIFVIFYVLLIRPQQKKEKDRQAMLSALKHDDEVVTTGGLHGRITALTDTVATLEIAQGVRVKVSRQAVAGLKSDKS